MISFEDAVMAGKNTEALHDMRVSSRRVLSMLKVFRPCFPQKAFKSQYAIIRALIRSLGQVRECDVFIGMLDTHLRKTKNPGKAALQTLRRRYADRRKGELRELQWTLRLLSQIRYESNFLSFVKKSL